MRFHCIPDVIENAMDVGDDGCEDGGAEGTAGDLCLCLGMKVPMALAIAFAVIGSGALATAFAGVLALEGVAKRGRARTGVGMRCSCGVWTRVW